MNKHESLIIESLIRRYGKNNILNELKDETYISAAKKRFQQKRFQSSQSILSHSKNILISKFQKTLQQFDWFHELDCEFSFSSPGNVQRLDLKFHNLPIQLHKNKFGWNEPTLPDNIFNDIVRTCIQFNNIIHGMDFYDYYFYKFTTLSFILLSREIVEKPQKTLFHVTNSNFLNKIKNTGLIPQQASTYWDTYYYNALFAVQKITDAKKYIRQVKKNQTYYIIEFKPSQNSIFYKDLIEINDGLRSAVYTHDSIPPENILRIYNQNMEVIYEKE